MTTPEGRSQESPRGSFTEAQLQVDSLRRLLDLSGLALARTTLDGRILYATPRFASALGTTVESVLTRPIYDFIPEDSRERITEGIRSAAPESGQVFVPTLTAAGEAPMLWTFRRATLADTTQEIHVRIQKIASDNGEPSWASPEDAVPVVLHPQPVTGRYHSDITPWELEETTKFRTEIAMSGAWVMDMASNSIVWSESAFTTLGVPIPEGDRPHIMGFEDWVHPDDLPRAAELLYERFISPGKFAIDVRGLHSDGRVRYIHAIGRTYKTDESKDTPDRAFGVFVDQSDAMLCARMLNMALRIDGILARARDGHETLFPDIASAITNAGGFSYAAYHRLDSYGSPSVSAYSGTNRFMVTEESKRVKEVFQTGRPTYLTDNAPDVVLAAFLPLFVLGKIDGVLVIWSEEPGQFTEQAKQYFGNLTANLGYLIDGLKSWELTQSLLRNITRLFGSAIESRSPFEAGRHARVVEVSRAIAQKMSMSEDEIFGIEIAASIYDMGMVWLPDRLTQIKPDLLSGEDAIAAQRHTTIGESLAAAYEWPFPVPYVMGQHHEHWDGSGYPKGLAGEQISIAARIVSVASAYERLVRVEGAGQRPQEALESVRKLSGTRFDPDVVSALSHAMNNGFAFKD